MFSLSYLFIVKDYKKYMKSLSQSATAALAKVIQAPYATLGTNDLLWVPAHSILIEKAGNVDTFGIKWSMVMPRDKDRYQKFILIAANKTTPAADISKFVVAVAQISAA